MRKLLDYIYTHYKNQIVNEKTSLIHILHHKVCSSKLIAQIIFNTNIEPNILKEKRNFPHLFDLTTILISFLIKQYLLLKPSGKVLDMGTGRYAILSIFLKKKFPETEIIASDIDDSFVRNAKTNIEYNNLDIKCYKSDLYNNIDENNFDYIIWNLPYYANPKSYLENFFEESANRLKKNGNHLVGMP